MSKIKPKLINIHKNWKTLNGIEVAHGSILRAAKLYKRAFTGATSSHDYNCSKLTEENPWGGETSRFLLKDEGVYLACEIHQLSACLQ